MNVTLKQTQSSLDIAGIGTIKPPSDAERLIDFDPLYGFISIKGGVTLVEFDTNYEQKKGLNIPSVC